MKSWLAEVDIFLQSLDTIVIKQPNVLPVYVWYLPDYQIYVFGFSVNENIDSQAFLERKKILQEMVGQNNKQVFLWEDVWRTKKEIVKSRLRSMTGVSIRIPARLTQVHRINQPIVNHFLEQNHLQGSTAAKYKYGLFLPQRYFRVLAKNNDEENNFQISELSQISELLVAVASFSGVKKIIRNGEVYRSYELIRFCNLLNCTVVGGLDKLLKNFIKELQPDDIMTYADRDWSDGRSYEKVGFERVGETLPQAFYVNSDTFERYYTPAADNSLIEIYNAGNWKYLMKLK